MELAAHSAPPGIRLTTDVCVIGAGPVGLAIARSLRSRGVQVVLLESGGSVPELDDGESAGTGYANLRDVRARGIGGTATIWNTVLDGVPMAKYATLDALDLEARPWMRHSGWPFPRSELDPWYERAHDVCGLSPYRPEETPDPHGYPLLAFPGGGLRTDVHHYGPASRFTRTIPDELRGAPGVILVNGATVTGLVHERGAGGRVREVGWRSLGEGAGTVRADSFVVAAGGIENARLLLLDREESGTAAGGAWLGEGFMEHPVDASLELLTHASALVPPEGFYSAAFIATLTSVVGRIALEPELLRAERLPNASMRLVHLPDPPGLRAAAARRAMHRLVPGTALRRMIGGAMRHVWRSSALAVGCAYRILLDLEQAPHRQNRVTLSQQRDVFHRRRARLEWHWTAPDEAHRQRLIHLVERELVRSDVGRVVRAAPPVLHPAAHHLMGTTRMHDDPAQGVVDADLRVHGMENLYVAGSSVFPTGGVANPTLTAIALALRLAHRLAGAPSRDLRPAETAQRS